MVPHARRLRRTLAAPLGFVPLPLRTCYMTGSTILATEY